MESILEQAIVDKPEKWVPKVGDWVVVLPSDKHYLNSEKDKACEIKSISALSTKNWYRLTFSNGNRNAYQEIRKALPHEIPKQEYNHMQDALGYMCQCEVKPIKVQSSNNLTTDKNEHTNHKGQTIEVRTVDRSISTGSTRRGESVQSRISPSRFGSVDKRYQA